MAAGQDVPEGLALFDDTVYWTVYGDPQMGLNGAVRKLAKDDPLGTPIDVAPMTGPGPAFIDVDATGVFWTNVYATGSLQKNGQNCVGPLDDVRALTIDGDYVYFVSRKTIQKVKTSECGAPINGFPVIHGDDNYGITVDANYIYWTDKSNTKDGGVWRMDKGGGLPTLLTAQPLAFEIAVGDGAVCYTTYEDPTGYVFVADLDLDPLEPKSLASGQPLPNGLAIDDGYCYWGTSGMKADYIARKRLDNTGSVETIIDGDLGIQALAFDEFHLYYTAVGSKTVSRIARP
ncbi:MAG: hypothetical protein R3B09_26285 [Nannocystaceae bacterium]